MAVGLSQRQHAGNGNEVSKQHVDRASLSLLGPACESVCSLCLSPSSPACFTYQSDVALLMPKKTALDKEMGDIFFGADDVNCMKDLAYKEDVIECMRMESARKSFKRGRRNGWLSIPECCEFVKLLCCVRF